MRTLIRIADDPPEFDVAWVQDIAGLWWIIINQDERVVLVEFIEVHKEDDV